MTTLKFKLVIEAKSTAKEVKRVGNDVRPRVRLLFLFL